MTAQDRTRLRLKQDFLVMLVEMGKQDESLRIDERASAPSVTALRVAVYPDWEGIIDGHISKLADSLSPKVGVPDFGYLSTVA